MIINDIKEKYPFDKVIDELGEPDKMEKDGNELIVLKWEDNSEKEYIYLSIELDDNKIIR